MDVFPIPPEPIRAIGFRVSARQMTFSISSSRPKHALGAGGGDSPSVLDSSVKEVDSLKIEAANLVWA